MFGHIFVRGFSRAKTPPPPSRVSELEERKDTDGKAELDMEDAGLV